MGDLKGERLVPDGIQGALFEGSLYTLVFNLQDDIGIGGAVNIHWPQLSSFNDVHGKEAALHDPVLV